MPQLDFSTYAAQIFWLAVTFVVLYFMMAKAALPTVREVLQNRQTRISEDLKKAEKLKEEAKEAEADFTSALADARQKAATMLSDVREKAAKEAEVRHARLDETFARQARESEKRVETLRQESQEKIFPVVVDIAQSMVSKLIQANVDAKNIEKVALDLSKREAA